MKSSSCLLVALLLVACANSNPTATSSSGASAGSSMLGDPALQPALASITSDGMLKHVRVLSADEFEGRLPGGRGEELTVAYIRDQFKALGLAPGNPDGSYTQDVPLVGITGKPSASFAAGGKTLDLKFPDEFVAFAPREQKAVDVDKSELVYVGYGVQAPEYGWDDYKGLDVRGKTLVMLINDPQIPDPSDPSRLDDRMFHGKAMTYYGRWTYKYEIAAKLGAAAAIIVHETPTAAYPWDVVRNSWGRENFAIKTAGPNPEFPDVAAWIQRDQAVRLFAASGLDFEAMKKAALSRDFKPVRMPATVNFHVENTWRVVASHNVVAKLEGADPKLRNEYVIYSAHWDHLGVQPPGNGVSLHDRIYHGALDNASGIGMLLSFAGAYQRLPQRPQRSSCSWRPPRKSRACSARNTMPGIRCNPCRIRLRTSTRFHQRVRAHQRFAAFGDSKSTLDDMLVALAADQGRTVKSDPQPERGGFYRSDQFEFAKRGVPVMHAKSGTALVGKPPGSGEKMINEFTTLHYHQPSDEINSVWDLSGAVEDARLLFTLGYEVAQAPAFPQWKAGAEFKPARDAMMAKP